MVLKLILSSKLTNVVSTYYCKGIHWSAPCQKLVPFILSDIGEGIREVTVRDWFVKPGDKISQFEDVCLVESDKASVNITSRYDGVVQKLHYEVGDTALVGKPLLDIDTPDGASDAPEPSSTPEESPVKPIDDQKSDESQKYMTNKALATPAVRRIAAQYNIHLGDVVPSGKAGRVLKEDILSYINNLSKTQDTVPTPTTTPTTSATDKTVPITGMMKIMVNTMTKSNNIPTFTFSEEIDVTKLVHFRSQVNSIVLETQKISFMPFFIKALSKSLEQFPVLNSSLDDKCENLTYKSQHNIGVAMDTKLGLVVPNIKNVQSMSINGISRELHRILEKGKLGVVSPSDLSGGTITISNIGNIGGTFSTPLILPPEVCIVGLGRIQQKPVFDSNGNVVKAHILYTNWSGDHRVIDGATMARFCKVWQHYVENPEILAVDL